jgi:hypothetical protein
VANQGSGYFHYEPAKLMLLLAFSQAKMMNFEHPKAKIQAQGHGPALETGLYAHFMMESE